MEHTVKAFDDDITRLRGLIAQMGGLAEQAIIGSMQALQRHDLEGAAAIVAGDKRIDAFEQEVERLLRGDMRVDVRAHVVDLRARQDGVLRPCETGLRLPAPGAAC